MRRIYHDIALPGVSRRIRVCFARRSCATLSEVLITYEKHGLSGTRYVPIAGGPSTSNARLLVCNQSHHTFVCVRLDWSRMCVYRYYSYKDMAVIARTAYNTRELEESLVARGVPYNVEGGSSFFSRPEVQAPIALLALCLNPQASRMSPKSVESRLCRVDSEHQK